MIIALTIIKILLLVVTFMGGYKIGEIIASEYAHDKNMHE